MDLYKKVQEIKEIKRIDYLEQYNFVKGKNQQRDKLVTLEAEGASKIDQVKFVASLSETLKITWQCVDSLGALYHSQSD